MILVARDSVGVPDVGVQLSPMLQPALAAIRRATSGMSDEQMVWHLEGKWSATEILEHLTLAYGRTAERMKKLLEEQGLPEVRRGTVKERTGALLVLRLGRIPPGRKAPEGLLPKGMGVAESRSRIEEKLLQVDQAIGACERRFGGTNNILVHTVLGPLSAAQWRRFHCVHTLHHMKQIQAIRRQLKIPAS